MRDVRVSVCMATYNGERYIARQLESILSQLSIEDEVIISDDESNDKTLDIIYQIKSKTEIPIHILTHKKKYLHRMTGRKHILTSGNFENAISSAHGKYIFLSDQDDVWLPNKVKLFLESLEDNALLVFSNFTVCDEIENVIKEKYFYENPQKWNFLKKNIQPLYWGCCMAFRSEILKWILPFPEKLYCHDAFIGLTVSLCAKKNQIKFIESPTLLYRRSSETVSSATKKSNNPLWFRLWWRCSLLFVVLSQTLKIKRGSSK